MDQSTKEFFTMFEGDTAPDTAMDGYIYLRWIGRYIYHLRKGLEGKAHIPEGDGGGAASAPSRSRRTCQGGSRLTLMRSRLYDRIRTRVFGGFDMNPAPQNKKRFPVSGEALSMFDSLSASR